MEGNVTVRQTIIAPMEAPRLRVVSTKNFIEFNKIREIYGKQISDKKKDPSTHIPLASYKTYI